MLYIDQPIGTGYSTGSKAASNNAEVTNNFFHWLMAFYGRFPGLKYKNTYIIGESYAGVYVRDPFPSLPTKHFKLVYPVVYNFPSTVQYLSENLRIKPT